MDCDEARLLLPDHGAGRLMPPKQAEVTAHLATCASCREAALALALGAALERMPRYPAPDALKRRLEAELATAATTAAATTTTTATATAASETRGSRPGGAAARPRAPRRWELPLGTACAAALATWIGIRAMERRPDPAESAATPSDLIAEAVNDHIRVASSSHPVEIESGGIHQVKPWFTGRLDFAPRVAFSGDDDFPLVGGSVGYFRDRKAAVFVFKRRLHLITLLVFPPDRLPWRDHGLVRIGALDIDEQTARGFQVLSWRDGDLGYALVSDVNRGDLESLAARLQDH